MNGAVLAVTLSWKCNNTFQEEQCAPRLVVTSLGDQQPFLKSWAHYYRRGDGAALREQSSLVRARVPRAEQ